MKKLNEVKNLFKNVIPSHTFDLNSLSIEGRKSKYDKEKIYDVRVNDILGQNYLFAYFFKDKTPVHGKVWKVCLDGMRGYDYFTSDAETVKKLHDGNNIDWVEHYEFLIV